MSQCTRNDGRFLERLLAFPMSDEMRAKEKFRKGEGNKMGWGKGSKEEDENRKTNRPRALHSIGLSFSEGGFILGLWLCVKYCTVLGSEMPEYRPCSCLFGHGRRVHAT